MGGMAMLIAPMAWVNAGDAAARQLAAAKAATVLTDLMALPPLLVPAPD
jgi:hypothetical protein